MLHEVAYALGLPVYVIENEMPASEYRNWSLFFQARPIGWREDRRAANICQSMAGGELNIEALFPSLKALKQYEDEASEQEKAGNSFAKSIFGHRLATALNKPKGG